MFTKQNTLEIVRTDRRCSGTGSVTALICSGRNRTELLTLSLLLPTFPHGPHTNFLYGESHVPALEQKNVPRPDRTEQTLFRAETVPETSSVATGGTQGGIPPTVDRHGHRIRANPMRFFWGEWGIVTALPRPPS